MTMTEKKQQGFLTIVAVILIVVFGFIGVVATYLVNGNLLAGANELKSEQAFYIAEGGLSKAIHLLFLDPLSGRVNCAAITGNANLTNVTFSGAAGPFTVTANGPLFPAASTLSAAVTASATTIAVNSAANYASSGRIMIDREEIDYAAISGNSFINVRRGVDGTAAVAHASGAAVGQYQCTLTAQAGVPTLLPAGNVIGGGRAMQQAAQLDDAWAVGASGSIVHWNNPTELQWSNATVATFGSALNSVYVLSYADAWLVGARVGPNFTIGHWNGSAWSAVAGPAGAQDLFSVYCTASNNCEAVGAARTVLVWNGASWAAQSNSGIPNAQLNSVYCNNANDCIAVGNARTFVRWNGAAWSAQTVSSLPNVAYNSVNCVSSNDCWAVGNSRAFVRWNGTAWSTQTVTSLPNVTYNSVNCVASDDCWAVGNNSGGSVTVHWDGASWTRNASPTTSTNLNEVKCNRSDDCWAVGASDTTLHWDGISWVQFGTPLASGVAINSVASVGYKTTPVSTWQELFP